VSYEEEDKYLRAEALSFEEDTCVSHVSYEEEDTYLRAEALSFEEDTCVSHVSYEEEDTYLRAEALSFEELLLQIKNNLFVTDGLLIQHHF